MNTFEIWWDLQRGTKLIQLLGGFGGMSPWKELDFPDLNRCILRRF